jgi:hypothetical protein
MGIGQDNIDDHDLTKGHLNMHCGKLSHPVRVRQFAALTIPRVRYIIARIMSLFVVFLLCHWPFI